MGPGVPTPELDGGRGSRSLSGLEVSLYKCTEECIQRPAQGLQLVAPNCSLCLPLHPTPPQVCSKPWGWAYCSAAERKLPAFEISWINSSPVPVEGAGEHAPGFSLLERQSKTTNLVPSEKGVGLVSFQEVKANAKMLPVSINRVWPTCPFADSQANLRKSS